MTTLGNAAVGVWVTSRSSSSCARARALLCAPEGTKKEMKGETWGSRLAGWLAGGTHSDLPSNQTATRGHLKHKASVFTLQWTPVQREAVSLFFRELCCNSFVRSDNKNSQLIKRGFFSCHCHAGSDSQSGYHNLKHTGHQVDDYWLYMIERIHLHNIHSWYIAYSCLVTAGENDYLRMFVFYF